MPVPTHGQVAWPTGVTALSNIGVDTASAFFDDALLRHFRTYPSSRRFAAVRQTFGSGH